MPSESGREEKNPNVDMLIARYQARGYEDELLYIYMYALMEQEGHAEEISRWMALDLCRQATEDFVNWHQQHYLRKYDDILSSKCSNDHSKMPYDRLVWSFTQRIWENRLSKDTICSVAKVITLDQAMNICSMLHHTINHFLHLIDPGIRRKQLKFVHEDIPHCVFATVWL